MKILILVAVVLGAVPVAAQSTQTAAALVEAERARIRAEVASSLPADAPSRREAFFAMWQDVFGSPHPASPEGQRLAPMDQPAIGWTRWSRERIAERQRIDADRVRDHQTATARQTAESLDRIAAATEQAVTDARAAERRRVRREAHHLLFRALVPPPLLYPSLVTPPGPVRCTSTTIGTYTYTNCF